MLEFLGSKPLRFRPSPQVIIGQVLTAGCGQNPARQTALKAGLPETCPALTINKASGDLRIPWRPIPDKPPIEELEVYAGFVLLMEFRAVLFAWLGNVWTCI